VQQKEALARAFLSVKRHSLRLQHLQEKGLHTYGQ
jgi:hypothetical protein